MKKILFMLTLFACGISSVCALTFNEIKVGDVYAAGSEVNHSYQSAFTYAYVAYYDKDDKLLEAYALDEDYDLYGKPYYIGDNCDSSLFCNDNMLIVSNDDSYTDKVKYWEVISINDPDVYEFCGFGGFYSYVENLDIIYPNSFCDMLYNYSSGYYVTGYTTPIYEGRGYYLNYGYGNYPFVVFKEVDVEEAKYDLVCETNGLKKGSVVNCELSVNSPEKIKEIIVSFDTTKYSIDKVKDNDNWTLDDTNVDGNKSSYTLVNDDGLDGESKVIDIKLILKEDVPSNFVIKTDNIDYILNNNIKFKSSAEDTIDFVEVDEEDDSVEEETPEKEVENIPNTDKKEEIEKEKNPATGDSIRIVVLFLILIGVTSYSVRIKMVK